MSSWYSTDGNDAIQSTLVQTNPGDTIYGTLNSTDKNGTWYVETRDANIGQSTSFTVSRAILVENQPWAYCALAVYNIDDCSNEMPPSGSSVVFRQLNIQKDNVNTSIEWFRGTNGQKPPVCDAKVEDISQDGTTVTIQF